MDGVTQQVALCDAVHSAGSQLLLRVLGGDNVRKCEMVKIKVL